MVSSRASCSCPSYLPLCLVPSAHVTRQCPPFKIALILPPRSLSDRLRPLQAPLPSTVPTFYRFLLTSDVTTVVQLTGFIERGIQKAEPYLPTSSAPVLSLPIPGSDPLTVRWLGSERRPDSGCEVTEIELSLAGGQTKRVTHLWFMGWPDKGVPTETDELTK